jgi:molybdopterin synthase catalytic subunit
MVLLVVHVWPAGHPLDSVGTMPGVSGQIESKSETDWLLLTPGALPVGVAYDWAVLPSCGAVVLFSGTVRDHAEGRDGVESLTYEAYEAEAVTRLAAVAVAARQEWPTCERVALLHRIGHLELSEASVAVVVSSPHRAEAFEAARFCIDTLKETVPIWKQEHWEGGSGWGTGASDLRTIGSKP